LGIVLSPLEKKVYLAVTKTKKSYKESFFLESFHLIKKSLPNSTPILDQKRKASLMFFWFFGPFAKQGIKLYIKINPFQNP